MRSIFFLFLMLLAACQQAHDSAESNEAVSPYIATAVGRIDSHEEARQLAAQVDGVIGEIFVQRGDFVRREQPLLRISCAPRLAAIAARSAMTEQMQASADTVSDGPRQEEIDASYAALDAARARLRDSEDRLSRAEALREKGFVTKRELEALGNARAIGSADVTAALARQKMLTSGSRPSEIAAARAASRAAYADERAAHAAAEQCMLRSPIDGRVLQILRQAGEFSAASQGQPLIVVGDISKVIVRAEINERDAAAIRVSQPVAVWVEGKNEKWRGRVTNLASIMGRRSARSLDPTDRFDRDVREALITFDGLQPPPLVGLRVTVGLMK